MADELLQLLKTAPGMPAAMTATTTRGTRVEVRFDDGKWYKGTLGGIVVNTGEPATITVIFDDKQTETFKAADLQTEITEQENFRGLPAS